MKPGFLRRSPESVHPGASTTQECVWADGVNACDCYSGAYNNAGLGSVGGVLTASMPPPPYSASHKVAGYSKPGHHQKTTPGVNSGPLVIPHGSTPAAPGPQQPLSSAPITPVFPGMVPSQNPSTPSPSPAPSPSVIKGGPPTPAPPSVIRTHTPSPAPGSFSPSPFHTAHARSDAPATSRGQESHPQAGSMSQAQHKAFLQSLDPHSGTAFPGMLPQQGNPPGSVIRSYTPSGPSSLIPGGSAQGSSARGQSPRASPAQGAPSQAALSPALYSDQQRAVLGRHAGGSGSNSPVPSAFKGTSRSGTPSVGSLVAAGSAQAALARSLGLSHPSASPQGGSLPSPAAMAGLHALSSSPVPSHYPGLSPFSSLASSLPPSSLPSTMPSMAPSMSNQPQTSMYPGLAPGAGPAGGAPFGLGLTSAPSMFPGHSAFPGFGGSGGPGAGSPVLSSFMGLPGATAASVASVAPLQAAAGLPSSSPVLPGFASAFSTNFQPGLSGGLQPPGGGGFPGLLSFPGVPAFSPSGSPASLSGLHNPAMQSALLQAHPQSALDGYAPQPNGFPSYAPGPGNPFPLHPQLGWQ
ncbi:Proline and serine-rich protein 1 [Merluccius polli]|uniref:Proline and serine-rich protein 1 n=1 Tax=Merluccius polli TaxID=89951 RepID=A0AA47LZ18_MERPO|nr:Proline and serine-rich protein 1 [Merluccius polli]